MVGVVSPPWNFADALGLSWVEVHGALTHFPVALLTLAGGMELGGILLRRSAWRTASFWLLAGAVLTGLPAVVTGWLTAAPLSGPHAPAGLPAHRLAGTATVCLSAALLAGRALRRDRMPGLLLPASAALLLLSGALVGLTGYLGGQMVFGGRQPRAAEHRSPRAASGSVSRAWVALADVERGANLFATQGCQSCHTMAGKGGAVGPDLSYEAARHPDIEWHIAHLIDPARSRPGSPMPSFRDLSRDDLRGLAAYMATRR